jgi:hypothetical protein
MTTALVLRSRVKGDFQARFWSGGGVGDRPADHNSVVLPVRFRRSKER